MKFFKVIILSVALTVVWSSGDNLEDYDQDSQDSQDDQDQDQDHPMLPPHEFIVKKTMWKTGKTRLKITLVLTRVCVKNFGRTAEELPDGQQNSSLTELQ
jgi:hypothetical protein